MKLEKWIYTPGRKRVIIDDNRRFVIHAENGAVYGVEENPDGTIDIKVITHHEITVQRRDPDAVVLVAVGLRTLENP